MDADRLHAEILRDLAAELRPRLRSHDGTAIDVAIKTALTKAIMRGLQRGFAEGAEEINKRWRVAIEQQFGTPVELDYRPPAPVEIPDLWAELYGP